MFLTIGITEGQLDYDALAFISAAGITDQTQVLAVHYLVFSLKTQGLWSKMNAIYPIIGGSASAHKFNAKDPRDVNAAYRLTFTGTWTHSANGMVNNANAYANTYLISNSVLGLNDAHISVYCQTDYRDNTITQVDIGINGGTDYNNTYLSSYYGAGSNYGTIANMNNTGFQGGISNTDSRGLWVTSRQSSTAYAIYKNGSSIASRTVSSAARPQAAFILGNHSSDAVNYGNAGQRRIAFASIGSGLSSTDVSNLYTIVQQYQTILSRNV
jgi:hypothetical protein